MEINTCRNASFLATFVLFICIFAKCCEAQDFDGENVGYYDPCSTPTAVLRGETFVFGVSYWPGYTVQNWGPAYNETSGTPGLNPCISSADVNGATVNYTQYLGDRGAVLTSYAVAVDSFSVLRFTKAEFDQLWDHIAPDRAKAVSMVAFKGDFRSEARYSASAEPYLTQGVGIATQMALVAVWDKGNFQGFEWFDFQTCAQCGGLFSDRCLRLQENPIYQKYPQTSCGAKIDDCSCRGLDCVSGNCTTAIYLAHRGTDRRGAVMQSAYQIQALNDYSVVTWFSKLWSKIDSAYDNQGSLIGNVGEGAGSGSVIVQVPNAGSSQSSFQAGQTSNTAATEGNCVFGDWNCTQVR